MNMSRASALQLSLQPLPWSRNRVRPVQFGARATGTTMKLATRNIVFRGINLTLLTEQLSLRLRLYF